MIVEEKKINNTLNSLKRQIEEIIKNRLRTSEIIDKSYITYIKFLKSNSTLQ